MNNYSKKEITKKLEEAISSSRRNSNLYLIIASIIFIFSNIGTLTPLTGIPVFFYNHKYLCKNSTTNNFDIVCSQKYICSNNKKFGIEYIINKKIDANIQSFISSYNLECSRMKKTLLGSSFFLGQLIGTIIYPYLVSYFGIINSLSINYFGIFISYLFMIKFNYYLFILIFYNLSSLAFQICVLGYKQYIVEMSDTRNRPLYLLFNLLAQIFSGFFVVLISYITLDYKYIFITSSIICFIGSILLKIFIVESIRILFIQEKIDKLMQNLEYISKINKSEEYFEEWKNNNQNIFYDNINNNLNLNNENLKPLIDINKNEIYEIDKIDNISINLDKINYLTILNYPSQVKLIILFSFATFYVNYCLVLAQFEIVKQNKFFISLLEGYICDMFGYIFGILITEKKDYTRKSCFLFLIILLIFIFIIQLLLYSYHNQFIFIFLRIFINSLDANFNLYNFESFPTLTRSTGVAINRIFGKFFNLGTPLIIINYAKLGYLFGLLFGLILFLLSIVLSPKENMEHTINEFPLEIINEYEKRKLKEVNNKNQNKDEEEYLLKE